MFISVHLFFNLWWDTRVVVISGVCTIISTEEKRDSVHMEVAGIRNEDRIKYNHFDRRSRV